METYNLENVWLRHGFSFKYYVDNHSIFRFIEKRDSIWRKHHLKTDETDPQSVEEGNERMSCSGDIRFITPS